MNDFLKRIATSFFVIPLTVYAVYKGGLVFTLYLVAITSLGYWEYQKISLTKLDSLEALTKLAPYQKVIKEKFLKFILKILKILWSLFIPMEMETLLSLRIVLLGGMMFLILSKI